VTPEGWNGAIVVAAGGSRRMEGRDKQFALLGGQTVLAWSVGAFEATPAVQAIVVVANPQTLEQMRALGQQIGWRKVVAVVPGGLRRQDSAGQGLAALETAARAAGTRLDLVLVHDGARPLVSRALIERGIAAAADHGAAIAAVRARDTVKVVDRTGQIEATPDRATLWHAQTPQVFRYDLLAPAYRQAQEQNLTVTDDAGLLEALGIPVYVFEGDPRNLKITTPEDLAVAEALLASYSPVMSSSVDPALP